MKRAVRGFVAILVAALLLAGSGFLLVCATAVPVEAQQKQAPAKKAPAAKAKAPAAKPSPAKIVKRRDPFRSLIMRAEDLAGGQALPPGKRGLVIPQLAVNGIVTMATGNIAVVTMAGRNRAYFLRERDEVYQGYVAQINEDSVVFKEKASDAFGKEYEREVVKQITAASGAKR